MLPTPRIIESLQAIFSIVYAAETDEIAVNCPYCTYRKMSEDKTGHLHLNFVKNAAHCVKCDWGHPNLRDWLKSKNFDGILPLPRPSELFVKPEPKPYQLQSAALPRGCSLMSRIDQDEFAQSLLDKNLDPDDWVNARCFKCTSGKHQGYVIFPFYENNNLVYWQGRAAWEGLIRKANPSKSELALGRASWLYGWQPDIPPGSHIHLCEGTLDKISAEKFVRKHYGEDHFVFALQGTAFSFPDGIIHPLNTQFGKLSSIQPSDVNILFDPDAIYKAKGLAKQLQLCDFEVSVSELVNGDPNEVSDEELKGALDNDWGNSLLSKLQTSKI